MSSLIFLDFLMLSATIWDECKGERDTWISIFIFITEV